MPIAYLKTDCEHCCGHIEYPSELAGQSIECPHCQQMTGLPSPFVPPQPVPIPPRVVYSPPVQNDNPGYPVCPHCNGQMVQITRTESSLPLQVLGVFVFLIGLGLCLTLIGAVIGIPLIIGAARMGNSKFPVMSCIRCGYFYKI